MADNVTLNAGSGGDVIAADDDGTAKHQYVKVEWGANNTQTPVASGASALPIQDGGNSITVDGTVSVTGQIVAGTAGTASTDVVTVQGIASMTPLSVQSAGAVAHDSADSGNPVKIGLKAETSPKGITLVADGDRTDAYADADGLQLVKLNTSGADAISESVSNTDGASTAFTNFSAVASTKNYITAYTAFRTDAGSSMAYIDLRDGTAGSVLWRIPLPPTGGAISPPYNGPCLFKTSANTALAFDVSGALSTVYISVAGYQSKV